MSSTSEKLLCLRPTALATGETVTMTAVKKNGQLQCNFRAEALEVLTAVAAERHVTDKDGRTVVESDANANKEDTVDGNEKETADTTVTELSPRRSFLLLRGRRRRTSRRGLTTLGSTATVMRSPIEKRRP